MRIQDFDAERDTEEAAALVSPVLTGMWGAAQLEPPGALDPNAVAEEMAALCGDGSEGLVARDTRGLAGFLLAQPGDGERGRHVWSEVAGHGYRDDPEVIRYLYRILADAWVAGRRDHHFVVASAGTPSDLGAWLDLAFGHEQVHAARSVRGLEPGPSPYQIRRASNEDGALIAPLVRLIYEANTDSPVFAYVEPERWDELQEGHEELLADPEVGYFVAIDGSRAIAYATMRPVPDDEGRPLEPTGTVELLLAGTLPEARGEGVMRALVAAGLEWAADRGHEVCVTDWRLANPGASRAWPGLGFVPIAHRLHRVIDSRVVDLLAP